MAAFPRFLGFYAALFAAFGTASPFLPGLLQQDGLPPGEGCFLPCSFWLADAYALSGRHGDAVRLFERLLGLVNDVGLLAEEYDPVAGRLLGNFPQAFSHVSLVNTACNLAGATDAPARHRR